MCTESPYVLLKPEADVRSLGGPHSDVPPGSFPPFPLELLLAIMEVAATESMPVALVLARVSKTVHTWITPIIYRTVLLRDLRQVQLFHDLRKVPTDALIHVRNLSHFNCYDPTSGFDTLTRYPQLQRLVLGFWAPNIQSNTWVGVTHRDSWPRPWEVVMLTRRAIGISIALLSHPIFRTVTHLYHASFSDGTSMVQLCQTLPRLTHFGFMCAPEFISDIQSFVSLTKDLLSANDTLEMVILHDSWPEDSGAGVMFANMLWMELAAIEDTRLLVGPGPAHPEIIEFLESGEAIWDHAKEKYGSWRKAARHAE